MTERRKWAGPFFLYPDLSDLVKDFLVSQGDKAKVYSPRILVLRAVEEYLSKRGYETQVNEIRDAYRQRQERQPARVFTLDKLTPEQREAVTYLMKWKTMSEQDSIKWVLEHKDKVEEAIEYSE